MNSDINGIHHITAIAGDPQKNVDFYVGILGLRMVKKTVNFDAPETYHLYYGDEKGNPGTILTFFPWGKNAWRGRPGTGQLTVISFSIPETAMNFWIERLKKLDISLQGPFKRFQEEVITFQDPDGIQLELVINANTQPSTWEDSIIPPEYTIAGFHSATMTLQAHYPTANLLTDLLNADYLEESGNRFRYTLGNGQMGNIIDIVELPVSDGGRMGAGTIHHIAWRVSNDETQLKKRHQLIEEGYQVTPVMDRHYFHSIYFREPGNVLFEIATDPPGFMIDESKKELGSSLKLPSWYELKREEIESMLPKIRIPGLPEKVKG
jgi:glyoxalase family protein